MLKRMIITIVMTTAVLFAFATMANAEEVLLSGNKRVITNSEEEKNPAVNIVDGSKSNNWAARDAKYDKYVVVDLGAVYELTEARIYPKQNRAYQYTISVSSNNATFETVVDKSDNVTGEECYLDNLGGAIGRYVKIHVTGEKDDGWVSFCEVEIYGDNTQLGLVNCALNKSATASKEQKDDVNNNVAENLTDGDVKTYWAAEALNGEQHNVVVDLGEPFYINSAELIPEDNRAYGYRIEGSYDGVNYVLIADMAENETADVLKCEFTPIEVRYVKLTITSIPDSKTWINIKELAIYGQKQGTDLYHSGEGHGITISGDYTSVQGVFKGKASSVNGRVMTLIIAVYYEDKMIGYKAETHFIPAYGEEVEKAIQITETELGESLEGKTVEVFVWDDLENMKTLVKPVKFIVNNNQ